MANYQISTKRGYDLYEVASALQKAIRRADLKVAGYFALELFESGYANYCWKRLMTVGAEDVHDMANTEVYSLFKCWEHINKGSKEPKGRIFITKAVKVLCLSLKSRDTDHLNLLVYDKMVSISAEELDKRLEEVRALREPIPAYAYDVHTKAGKMQGKTKADFIKEELNSLKPKQPGLFDEVAIDYANAQRK